MKKLVCILFVAVLLFSVVACAQKAETEQPQNEASETKTEVAEESAEQAEYVFIYPMSGLEYWNAWKKGFVDACEELGAKATLVTDDELDVNTMTTLMTTTIERGVDGILYVGYFAEAMAPLIDEAYEKGIPTVTCVAPVPNSKRICHLGTDYYDVGKIMGQTAAESVNGEGEVLISTSITSGSGDIIMDILEGIQDSLAEYPNIKILEVLEDKSQLDEATKVIGAALQVHPDVDVIIGSQSVSATGAVTALREAGIEGVKVISIDRDTSTLDAIKNGDIYATVAAKDYTNMYLGTMILDWYNKNKMLVATDPLAAGIIATPEYVDTSVTVIDQNNIDYFLDPDMYKID